MKYFRKCETAPRVLQNLGWKALAQRMVTKFWQLLGHQAKPFNLNKPHFPHM